MPRIKASDIDHYGGGGGAGFFSLKDDKDVARVRFMYNDIEEIDPYVVHEVEIDGRKRYVNCLREYDQPVDDCPFCRERMRPVTKLFLQIYNVDEDKTQVWERGKKFYSKISSLAARYPDMIHHEFEIERNGQKGDTSTTYEIYEVGNDETEMDDLPEASAILGGVVLDKTAEDMEYFLTDGVFPPDEDEEPQVVRRRSAEPARSARASRTTERAPARGATRRTPARNKKEVF